MSRSERGRVVALDGLGDEVFDVRRAYQEHGGEIFGFVLNSLGDRMAAEDCVQETFLRAWRARDRFDLDAGSERTWLFAIARNVVIDSARSRSRRPITVGEERIASAPGLDIAGEEGRIMDRMVLYEAMAALTPEHREVIASVQLDGMSYQQLADRTGVSVATLRTRTFYALKALRARIGEEGHHG